MIISVFGTSAYWSFKFIKSNVGDWLKTMLFISEETGWPFNLKFFQIFLSFQRKEKDLDLWIVFLLKISLLLLVVSEFCIYWLSGDKFVTINKVIVTNLLVNLINAVVVMPSYADNALLTFPGRDLLQYLSEVHIVAKYFISVCISSYSQQTIGMAVSSWQCTSPQGGS